MQDPSQLLKALGDELRHRRSILAMSQEQLALNAGVNRTYVAKLELAKNQPTLLVLFKLATALEVDVADFVRSVQKRIKAQRNPG